MSDDAPALAKGLDEAGFTTAVTEYLGGRLEGTTLEITGPLELRAEVGEELELVYSLEDLWESYGKGELGPADLDEVAEGLQEALADEGDGDDDYSIEDLVAIVQPEGALDSVADAPVLCVPLAGDLMVAFAWIEEGAVTYLTDEDAEELEVDVQALFNEAVRRTLEDLPEPEVEELGEALRLNLGGGPEVCALLDLAMWEHLADEMDGPLLVTVPNPEEVVFIADGEGAREKLLAAAKPLREEGVASEAVLRFAAGGEWEVA